MWIRRCQTAAGKKQLIIENWGLAASTVGPLESGVLDRILAVEQLFGVLACSVTTGRIVMSQDESELVEALQRVPDEETFLQFLLRCGMTARPRSCWRS